MPRVRLAYFAALTALVSCASCAEKPVVEAATQKPAAIADLSLVAGAATSDIAHAAALESIVNKTIRARDFASLNAMADYFRTSRSRFPGGTWELAAFHEDVIRALEGPKFAGSSCELKGTDVTKEWMAFDPGHPAPYLAEAALLVSYGWCLRGGAFAGSTPRQAMQSFGEYLDAGEKVLSDHEDVARRDPEYYALMEKIYMAQGRGDWAFSSLFDEGSARFPYYYGIYFRAAERAMPQWGGSYEKVDEVARYAAEHTRQEDGDGAYVRVYWNRAKCGCDLTQFRMDRAMLAGAMEDVMKRTPSSFNAAHFSFIACKLGDRDLTAKQLARFEDTSTLEWEDQVEKQLCRDFAAQGT